MLDMLLEVMLVCQTQPDVHIKYHPMYLIYVQ